MTFEIAPPRRGKNPLSDLEATRQSAHEQRASVRNVAILSGLMLALAAMCFLLHMQAFTGARPEREEPAVLDVLAPERPGGPAGKLHLMGAEEPERAAPAPEAEAAPAAPPAAETPPAEPAEPVGPGLPTIDDLKRGESFRRMVERKTRVEEIDGDLLFEAIDVGFRGERWREVYWGFAKKIEPKIALHIFTWLCGKTPGQLAERAAAEAAVLDPSTDRPRGRVRYRDLIWKPEPHRGRIVRFHGSVIKVAGVVPFPEDNPSGVRDTTMVFARSSASAEIYVFLLPVPPQELLDLVGLKTKLIEIDGVFMKDYTVEKKDNTKELMPLVLALGYRRVEMETSSPWAAAGIAAAAVLFGAFIFVVALREMRGSRAARREFAHRRLARRAGSEGKAGDPSPRQGEPSPDAPPLPGSSPPDGD